ncbi:Unknown protein sequence [Pseudomonas syringae pv. cilantro]|uniref:Uncharacterized protein n=1 Tax=Pseudomonas syringae pv. cilantro TaxID=81035 RepID=A0A0N0X8D6_PSESX|nr:Unknown protein sequence [Pseudomonas syringae pv. cilantro]
MTPCSRENLSGPDKFATDLHQSDQLAGKKPQARQGLFTFHRAPR